MNQDDRFLKQAYIRNLLPIMSSVLGGTINALIDSVFVSRAVGSAALAAVNLGMPVYLALCTIGSLLSGGAYVLAAQELGKERLEAAKRYYHTALTLCAVLGVAMTVIGMALCRSIAVGLSQGGNLGGYVYDYCFVTFLGAIPTILIYLPMSFLQLDGKTRDLSVMVSLMVGIDIALDALFMLPLEMGIRGAALASVISTLIATIYGFFALEHGYSNFHVRLRCLSFSGTGRIVRYGSPAALGNLFDAVKLLGLNAIVLSADGEAAASVWAVLNTLSELSLIIISGVPRSGAPMLGVYYTARENSRIRILLKLECQIGAILAAVYALVIAMMNVPIRMLFHLESPILYPLLCLGVSAVFYLLCSIWEVYCQAVGRLAFSNLLLAARRLVFPVGIALILVRVGGLLWLFLPLSGALTLLLGYVVTGIEAGRTRDGGSPVSRYLLLDDSLERENKVIDFSIPPDMSAVCSASEQIQDFCRANNMSSRQVIQLGLAIEELLNVLIEKIPDIRSVDLRAFALDGTTGLRIRCAGQIYNPFEDDESDMDFLLGVNLIKKMSENVSHTYTLGMNTLNIQFIGKEGKANV